MSPQASRKRPFDPIVRLPARPPLDGLELLVRDRSEPVAPRPVPPLARAWQNFANTTRGRDMSTEPETRAAQLHIAVFVPSGSRGTEVYSTEDPVELTPERMSLKAELVDPHTWVKNRGPERTTWEPVKAGVSKYVQSD